MMLKKTKYQKDNFYVWRFFCKHILHSKRSVFCISNVLCLRGIYKDCVCREYTKIVFAGNIQRLGKWLIDMRTAHWECLGLGFMQRGLAPAALMRCCWPLLCCFCAFVHALCALHHTDVQLLSLTRTKVCTEQHSDQLLHIHWHTCTHTHVHAAHWPIGGGERSPNNRSPALQSRSSSHAQKHTYMCTHSFLYWLCIVPVLCGVMFFFFCIVRICILSIVHCSHYCAHCVLCSARQCVQSVGRRGFMSGYEGSEFQTRLLPPPDTSSNKKVRYFVLA